LLEGAGAREEEYGTLLNHFVEAQDGAGLQHPTQDGLLSHQIRLHL
jgi:hypothetical protein